MKVLFVTPSDVSSGEAITALHMADGIIAHHGDVHFLASEFTSRFFEQRFSTHLTTLSSDGVHNRALWTGLLRQVRPQVVVFADYPLLFFSNAVSPLADESWVAELETVDAELVTLDSIGYAQAPGRFFFGPPHLTAHSEIVPALPERMTILLPCPIQEPGRIVGRKGIPFRYWQVPLGLEEPERRETRERYLGDPRNFLIVHSTPDWAWKTAQRFGLPYYAFLSKLLEYYLADLPRPVTVVAINNGHLVSAPSNPRIRIVNLPGLATHEFDRLVLTCDLMITENRVSVSLSKAVCGLRPCAVLRNSYSLRDLLARTDAPLSRLIHEMERARLGAVYPYEVFPMWRQEDLDQLGIFQQNTLAEGFASVEIFGGETTRRHFGDLLMDEETRRALKGKQDVYVRRLEGLPEAHELLSDVSRWRPS